MVDDSIDASLLDADRILQETWIEHVESFRVLDSTNSHAMKKLQEGVVSNPLLICAKEQTAGRGRGANRWFAGSGALTFSLVLDLSRRFSSNNDDSLLPLLAGSALCESLRRYLPSAEIGLKWPNDVLVSGRKISGILIESLSVRPRFAVVGVGVNVNNSLPEMTEPTVTPPTSLFVESGEKIAPLDLLIRFLQEFEIAVTNFRDGDSRRRSSVWNKWDCLAGKLVTIRPEPRPAVEGLCRGIDEAGCLVLDTAHGMQRFHSGTIERIECVDHASG